MLLVVGLAPGCNRSAPPPANLVLISVDSLRWDRLGVYGADAETSPAIDRLASEGGLFETVMAPTSWTLPSHVTLLTGLSIPVHGVIEPRDQLDERRTALAQHLVARGYKTAGFVSAPFLHSAYGFARGFDRYVNYGVAASISGMPNGLDNLGSHGDETAAEVIDAAIAWLSDAGADSTAPYFLFVHLWDPHYDYIPPAPYSTMFDPDYEGDLDVRNYEISAAIGPNIAPRDLKHLKALYDGEIRWTDGQLGRLLEAIEEKGRPDRTVVSLVADHGEEFFEHGRKGHGKALFEESVRIPWIVRFPGRVAPNTRIGGVVSLEDVAPTLLALMDAPPLPEATGRSFAGYLTGESSGAPADPVLLSVGELHALRGPDWKIITHAGGRNAQEFDLARDPGETRPIRNNRVNAERLRALEARIAHDAEVRSRLKWGAKAEADIDDATSERLRELGYIK